MINESENSDVGVARITMSLSLGSTDYEEGRNVRCVRVASDR